MSKFFSKVALAALVLMSSSAFAGDGSLLAFATKGSITVASASDLSLSNAEMEQVKGGQYIEYYHNVSNSIVQTLGFITETYQGSNLWVVAEKYGSTLNSGYDIYLANRNGTAQPAKVNSMYGQSYSLNTVVTNPVTYGILSPYLEIAKASLSKYRPKYN